MKNLGWKSNFAILWPKVPRWWILNSTMVSLNNFQKMRNYLLIFDGSCEEIFNSKAFLKVATAVPHCGLNWFHNSIVQSITWFVPKNGWTFTVLYKQWFRTNKILSSKTFTNNCNCFFAQLVVILSTIASFIARNLLSKTWETSVGCNVAHQRDYFNFPKTMKKFISTKHRVFISLVGTSGSRTSRLIFDWLKSWTRVSAIVL